jgi:quercetin dioxygenase-like cupin family protein
MILKSSNATKKEFKGVTFDVLAIGEKTMVTVMNYKEGEKVPLHSHPNEQSGYVISGKYRVRFGTYDEIVSQGDSYSIPENTEHALEVIEPGHVVDVFCPIRQDYL